MSEIARAKTGIPGLDEALEGGLLRNYSYSIVGAPGSGKTIMGAQFIYRGATQYAENGIYVSLEEPVHSIANSMLRFNWNLFDLESQAKVVLLDAAPYQDQPGSEFKIRGGAVGYEKFDLDGLLGAIAHARKKVAAKRCIIDSLSTINGAYKTEAEFRYRLVKFFRALSELELTTLILTESHTAEIRHFGIESILAHGCLLLHNLPEKQSVVQLMEIQKMRSVRVPRRIVPYRITSDGIDIPPQ